MFCFSTIKVDEFPNISFITNIFRTLPYKTTIRLRNISNLQCAVTVTFPDNSLYSVPQKNLKIDPATVGEVDICIKPMRKGLCTGDMIVAIKNNPKIYSVRLHAKAVPLDFTYNPKAINFEKVRS